MEAKVIVTTEPQLKAYIADALRTYFTYNPLPSPTSPTENSAVRPLVISSEQLREMTGWPPSTFSKKVSEMPEGIVVRRGKRLCFVTEPLLKWLTTSEKP